MPTLNQTKNQYLRLLPILILNLLYSLALSGCSDLPESTESYDTMPKQNKPDSLTDSFAHIPTPMVLIVGKGKQPATLQPADTSDPDKLPPYVLSGPSVLTFETAGDQCHLAGRRLPKGPITGLENLRYFLAGGLFVRMGNEVGSPDPGSQMIAWVVCEP